MATDTVTSGPICLAADIQVTRHPESGLTLQLSHTQLRIRSGTWAEIRFALTGTRIWTSRSSAKSPLPNDSEWNSVSRCLTRRTLPFGRFQSRTWTPRLSSGKSRIRPTYLDSYSSESSFTSECRLRSNVDRYRMAAGGTQLRERRKPPAQRFLRDLLRCSSDRQEELFQALHFHRDA